jgi:starch synthase
MAVERVLFVNQGIEPYVDVSYESKIGKHLPLNIQEKGVDTRIFMPKYGLVSEKKQLLHEVIRLSGQTIVINRAEHPLTIKVSSIPALKLQTYFIVNDHYFGSRKQFMTDEAGKPFSDNDERAIFYARGVMETVKSLSWTPDIIHCHGWISCLVPVFLKKFYVNNPIFSNTKVVFSVYGDHSAKTVGRITEKKLNKSGIPLEDAERYKQIDYETALKLAIEYADGVVVSQKTVSKSIREHIAKLNKPVFEHRENRYGDSYMKLYQKVVEQD